MAAVGRNGGIALACAFLAPFPASAAQLAMTEAATLQNGNVIVLSALACGGVALALAAGAKYRPN